MVANVFIKMSILQLLLLSQLYFYVNGANEFSSLSPTELANDKSVNVTSGVNRIIGGYPTSIKEYPFMVSIQWRYDGSHRCGGTYILSRYVLTAAHCVFSDTYYHTDNPHLLIAVAGTASLRYVPTWQIKNIDKILAHRKYNPTTMSHDIALIRLEQPFRITPYITYVKLPTEFDEHLISKHETSPLCTVVGWGRTSVTSTSNKPEALQFAKVPLIKSSQCDKYSGYHHISHDHICAGYELGGIDACQGDSGGPLLCGDVQVGIISWGMGCAAAYAPGVYNRIDVHLTWINETVTKSNGSSSISNHVTAIMFFIVIWKLSI